VTPRQPAREEDEEGPGHGGLGNGERRGPIVDLSGGEIHLMQVKGMEGVIVEDTDAVVTA